MDLEGNGLWFQRCLWSWGAAASALPHRTGSPALQWLIGKPFWRVCEEMNDKGHCPRCPWPCPRCPWPSWPCPRCPCPAPRLGGCERLPALCQFLGGCFSRLEGQIGCAAALPGAGGPQPVPVTLWHSWAAEFGFQLGTALFPGREGIRGSG